MKRNLTLLLTSVFLLTAAPLIAQTTKDTAETVTITINETDVVTVTTAKSKGYISVIPELGVFQSAAQSRPGTNRELTYLRYSFAVNLEGRYNYDFNDHFSAFIGLGIKNLGFTDKIGDLTIKRRVYTLGVPVGLRIGNLGRNNFVLIGGGIDLPVNYREKSWTNRKHKQKFNEWFSDRTPVVMPYLFAGVNIKTLLTLKLSVYTSNFFNTSFEVPDGSGGTYRPYTNYDARLITLSLGFRIPFKKRDRVVM
jgi:hypothetical protein